MRIGRDRARYGALRTLKRSECPIGIGANAAVATARPSSCRVVAVIYRGMREASDGQPEIGRSGSTLGVRPGPGDNTDIPVDHSGDVVPKTGGMSVAPETPESLPPHRRPPESPYPAWELRLEDLPADLMYRPDPENPSKHGFVEPSIRMPFQDYEDALASTRTAWTKAIP